MKFLTIAFAAMLGFAVQARAETTSFDVNMDQDTVVTRVSDDGKTAQIQKPDGTWANLAVSDFSAAQADQALKSASVPTTSDNCAAASCTEKAQLVWGRWGGWGWHHRLFWGHRWYHPYRGWGGGGWHYHYWHRNWWHRRWWRHGWWR